MKDFSRHNVFLLSRVFSKSDLASGQIVVRLCSYYRTKYTIFTGLVQRKVVSAMSVRSIAIVCLENCGIPKLWKKVSSLVSHMRQISTTINAEAQRARLCILYNLKYQIRPLWSLRRNVLTVTFIFQLLLNPLPREGDFHVLCVARIPIGAANIALPRAL